MSSLFRDLLAPPGSSRLPREQCLISILTHMNRQQREKAKQKTLKVPNSNFLCKSKENGKHAGFAALNRPLFSSMWNECFQT